MFIVRGKTGCDDRARANQKFGRGVFLFVFLGNCLSNSSAAVLSTKYRSGGIFAANTVQIAGD